MRCRWLRWVSGQDCQVWRWNSLKIPSVFLLKMTRFGEVVPFCVTAASGDCLKLGPIRNRQWIVASRFLVDSHRFRPWSLRPATPHCRRYVVSRLRRCRAPCHICARLKWINTTCKPTSVFWTTSPSISSSSSLRPSFVSWRTPFRVVVMKWGSWVSSIIFIDELNLPAVRTPLLSCRKKMYN